MSFSLISILRNTNFQLHSALLRSDFGEFAPERKTREYIARLWVSQFVITSWVAVLRLVHTKEFFSFLLSFVVLCIAQLSE